MYDEKDYIEIDVFKGLSIYNRISQFNEIVDTVARSVEYPPHNAYDVKKNQASFWFNPDKIRYTPLPSMYPEIHPIQHDNRLSLITHCVNHEIILIIETLFNHRRDILIEDICCGMGNQIFYLSKLGFKSFSAIDNFSQLPRSLFVKLMQQGPVDYILNDHYLDPIVSSLVAYTKYIKRDSEDVEIFSESLELFLSYVPLIPESKHLSIDNTKFFKTFRCLGKDPYRFLWSYCREDMYKEFSQKLQDIKL